MVDNHGDRFRPQFLGLRDPFQMACINGFLTTEPIPGMILQVSAHAMESCQLPPDIGPVMVTREKHPNAQENIGKIRDAPLLGGSSHLVSG